MMLVNVEVKRVVRILRIMGVASLCLGPADDFAHVFNQGLAFGDVLYSKDTFSVDAGATRLDAPLRCGSGDIRGFFGHGAKFGMVNRMGACVRACVCERAPACASARNRIVVR